MFTNIEALDSSKHGNLLFKPVSNYAFAAGVSTAPISATEIVEAAKYYPVSFALEEPLLPIALLSLTESRNAFLNGEGKWLTPYVPAHVRRYPFLFGATNAEEKFVVMADLDAPQLGCEDGEPLYTADGASAPILEKAIEFLTVFHRELEATKTLLQPLDETGVLTAKPMEISTPDGEKIKIKGVRTVDQKKLMALDDATLAAWVRSGLMGIIYAHASSQKNLAFLVELEQLRAREKASTPSMDPF